jgi:hypothetical protein
MRAARVNVVHAPYHSTLTFFRTQRKMVCCNISEPVLGYHLGQELHEIGAWLECIYSSIRPTSRARLAVNHPRFAPTSRTDIPLVTCRLTNAVSIFS